MFAVDTAGRRLTVGRSPATAIDEFPPHQLIENQRANIHIGLANVYRAKRFEHVRMGWRIGHGWQR
ncbi:hypothetical protein BX592_11018 [Paraburkholderia rhizosphaerae]|uniref:Uncharacterized protein n=1 Tax=Paraburkholderia rhizosphaerae TaxID=480658 RepID=A0A4R8LSS9_9BURK|nr:hypothetical protein BX592_11018 [Paraburkholderia rhizosphaerae]